ncbi:MAG: hypothetical protein ACK47M_03015 [Caldilinea sp.]
MTFRRFIIILFTIAMLSLLVACGGGSSAEPTPTTQLVEPTPATQPVSPLTAPISPLAAPDAALPEAGKAAITGRLIDLATGAPLRDQNLSLPAVLCAPGVAEEDKREQCFYMVDEAFDPSALTDDEGNFIFQNIQAGEYVMLVGSLMTENVILKDELNRPIIWKAITDTVVALGDIVVEFGTE